MGGWWPATAPAQGWSPPDIDTGASDYWWSIPQATASGNTSEIPVVGLSGLFYCFCVDGVGNSAVYDPGSDTWTLLAAIPTARTGAGGAPMNGYIYVFGGATFDNVTHLWVSSNETDQYDPSTNTWTVKATMPTETNVMVDAATQSYVISMTGYNTQSSTYLLNTQVYTPGTNTWATKTACPNNHANGGGGVAAGYAFSFAGGNGGYGSLNDMYDPVADTWTSKAALSNGWSQLQSATMHGRIFRCFGRSSGALDEMSVEAYDYLTNAWISKSASPLSPTYSYFELGGAAGYDDMILMVIGTDSSYADATPVAFGYAPA